MPRTNPISIPTHHEMACNTSGYPENRTAAQTAGSSFRIRVMKESIVLVMLSICPMLQGCVGFVVLKQHTQAINNPVIYSRPNDDVPAQTRQVALKEMAASKEFEEVIRQIKVGHETGVNNALVVRAITNATNDVVWVVYTPLWLQTHWGSPARICHSPTSPDEIWIYRFGPIWEGVMPILIVPIPLELPVGEKKVCFTLRDGHVVSVDFTTPALGGWMWPSGI